MTTKKKIDSTINHTLVENYVDKWKQWSRELEDSPTFQQLENLWSDMNKYEQNEAEIEIERYVRELSGVLPGQHISVEPGSIIKRQRRRMMFCEYSGDEVDGDPAISDPRFKMTAYGYKIFRRRS